VTTELPKDEEDRHPRENMDRMDAEDFFLGRCAKFGLLSDLLLVSEVCDDFLDSIAVGARYGVCVAVGVSTLGGGETDQI
jgi:hypothetical protein